MKKIFLLILCLAVTLTLFACDATSGDVSEQAGTASDVSEEASAEVSEEEPKDIKVNGVSLKDFTIVYCESTTFDGYNHYRLLVNEINTYLKENYGYTLKAVPDSTKETENEILVGLTAGRELKRAFKASDFATGQYALVVKGHKVMLAGAYANGWHNAFEEFISCIEAETDGDIDRDFVKQGEKPAIKVVCVGDSITQGVNSDSNDMTYPSYLQEMLGWDYCVYNAGLSGYAICNTDRYAYIKSQQYKNALNFNPDVVLFALGTNDSNPGQDWKDWSDPNRKDLFLNSTREILDSFYANNENVQIFIFTPTPLFPGKGSWDAVNWNKNIDAYSLPLIKQIAEEYALPQVDLYTWGKDNGAVFTDGLHPKNQTYKTYAKAVYDRIANTLIKNQEN